MFKLFKPKTKPKHSPVIEKPKEDAKGPHGLDPFYLDPNAFKTVRNIEQLNTKIFSHQTSAAFDHATDNCADEDIKSAYRLDGQSINPVILEYFANTSAFIGYQNCAILAQKKLMGIACTIKAEEAVKNWFDIAFTNENENDNEVDDKVLAYIRKSDIRFKVKDHVVRAERFKNIFGIRHILFKVDSMDPDYYLKPFNPDSVAPGSYKGMHQVDPIFVVPEFTDTGLSDPLSKNFYNPLYWVINGVKIHRSHFVIIYGDEVADILKPSYRYGGIPLVQQIYERLYKAERTANEAPELALTKRLNIRKTNLAKALSTEGSFLQRMRDLVTFRDNYGILIADNSEDIQQIDTSLADYTDVVNNQYQIFASECAIPAAKLLSTSPQGMNATGEFEMKNYNQEVSKVQENRMTPILHAHYERLLRSEIYPKFDLKSLEYDITWNPLDNPTAIDVATVENMKAQTDATLVHSQAITPDNVRERLSQDVNSPYFNIDPFEDVDIDEDPDEDIDGDKSNEDIEVDEHLGDQ
jgi:phage-related protein (TIGR01555 family)